MKKNRIALILAGAMMLSSFGFGCGKKKAEETTTEATTEEIVVDVKPMATMGDASDIQVISMEGMVINEFTGEWIDESLADQRPVCIMINNIDEAMPQSGISQADITWEMLVEGGVTRYLCLFKDYKSVGKIGPVRSARHYYVKLSNYIGAVYAHVGWSAYAEQEIKETNTNNINGLFDAQTFYRDNSRYAPHNCYTDGEKLAAGIASAGYSSTYTPCKMFAFNSEDKMIGNGQTANKVITAYNGNPTRWFEYNEEDQRYYRWQYNVKQIDDQTNEQLNYKNVIVMYVSYSDLGGGLQDINWLEGGDAYYFTDGEYEAINWKYEDYDILFCTMDGKQLKMNPGNTFITVFRKDQPQNVIIE